MFKQHWSDFTAVVWHIRDKFRKIREKQWILKWIYNNFASKITKVCICVILGASINMKLVICGEFCKNNPTKLTIRQGCVDFLSNLFRVFSCIRITSNSWLKTSSKLKFDTHRFLFQKHTFFIVKTEPSLDSTGSPWTILELIRIFPRKTCCSACTLLRVELIDETSYRLQSL